MTNPIPVLTSSDITFTAGSHRYHITETKPKVYIPSVTTICGLLDKPFLVEWAAREAATAAAHAVAEREVLDEEAIVACIAKGRSAHRDLREHGASVGTAVHQQIKKMLVAEWEPDEERVDGGIEAELAMSAFTEWWDEARMDGWEVVYCERIVVHPTGKYVGTFDLLLRHRNTGAYRMVDFKTSNQSEANPLALYPEYLLQISAYRQAVISSPEYEVDDIEDAVMLALGKNGQLGVTIIDRDDLDQYALCFNHMSEVIDTYRMAQRNIRALNKVEKARRTEQEVVA